MRVYGKYFRKTRSGPRRKKVIKKKEQRGGKSPTPLRSLKVIKEENIIELRPTQKGYICLYKWKTV